MHDHWLRNGAAGLSQSNLTAAEWIIKFAEYCLMKAASSDDALAKSIGIAPIPSYEGAGSEGAVSPLPVASDDQWEFFRYPVHQEGSWIKYKRARTKEFKARLEAGRMKIKTIDILPPAHDILPIPRRTKAGKKYNRLHYQFAALSFCRIGWNRIHGMYPDFGSQQAMTYGAKDVVSRIGLLWPVRSKK
jgi:hypothetical protein